VNERSETRSERSLAEVRAEIDRTREEIVCSAAALRQQVAMRMDWRQWVKQNPGFFLAGAFGVGVWLGSQRRRR
jgi:hypothetical protein